MIQIDMDMPTNCTQCPFSDDEPRYCRVANEYIPMFSKPDFCPLIEVKDAVEKAVAVEAISDELMSRFDISATQAYEIAETVVKRIEVRMEKTNRGEQE